MAPRRSVSRRLVASAFVAVVSLGCGRVEPNDESASAHDASVSSIADGSLSPDADGSSSGVSLGDATGGSSDDANDGASAEDAPVIAYSYDASGRDADAPCEEPLPTGACDYPGHLCGEGCELGCECSNGEWFCIAPPCPPP
jgi:hypothetical protein